MSKLAKVLWLIAGLSLVSLFVARTILGGWLDFFFIPLVIFVLSFITAIAIDIKYYFEFLTLKTTKLGMSMGVMILLVVTLLIAVNYLGVKYNKTFDFTEEKLNSLAPQTMDILDSLDSGMKFVVLYRGAKDAQQKNKIKEAFKIYTQNSNRLIVEMVDSYVENVRAESYLRGQQQVDQVVMFVELNEKRVRVEYPFTEQNIVSAMIKASRKSKKHIYFLTGHGEKNFDSTEQEGTATFKKILEDASYDVKALKLIETPEVPSDADVIVIVGPQVQLLGMEIDLLKSYLRQGGSLLVAADPGFKHNIRDLLDGVGVEYKNNYIINDSIQLQGRGLAGVLGVVFDAEHAITKKFIGRESFTIFDLTSEVVPSKKIIEGLKVAEIIRSADQSFSVNDLQKFAVEQSAGNVSRVRGVKTFAVAVKGKLKDAENEFTLVAFGDSDFLSEKDILQGLNSDVALNSVSFLADEVELISIKPKQPRGTSLDITSMHSAIITLGGVALPLVFLFLAGWSYYRRRNS